jgi:tetratricopeptide (TPR) repeat protein
VAVPVKHTSDIGFRLINSDDAEGTLEVFEYHLANISDDAIAHYSVGFALKQLGRLEEALPRFEKAVELGTGMDMYTAFVRFRDEVLQEINEKEQSLEPSQ